MSNSFWLKNVRYIISGTNYSPEGIQDGFIILDYGLLNEQLGNKNIVKNAKLIKEVNKVEQLTFTIYPDHPNFSKLKVKETTIKVAQYGRFSGTTLFVGRIVKEKINFNNSKDITCEGLLSFLVDNPFNDTQYILNKQQAGENIADFVFDCDVYNSNKELVSYKGLFEELIINFNNDLNKSLGKIGVNFVLNNELICPRVPNNDDSETKKRYYLKNGTGDSLQALILAEELKNKSLFEILNYFIENAVYYKKSGTKNEYPLKYFYLDYDYQPGTNEPAICICTDYDLENEQNLQEINFGENLMDLFLERDASSVITAISPSGEAIVYDSENKSTLAPVSIPYKTEPFLYDADKGIYIYRNYMYLESEVKKYGWIVDDTKNTKFFLGTRTDPDYLLQTASRYIQGKSSLIKEKLTVSVADLAFASGYDATAFQFMKYIRGQYHDMTFKYLITKMEYDLSNPSKNKITFSLMENSLTKTVSSGPKNSGGISGTISNNSGNIKTDTEKLQTEIDKTNSEINLIKNNYATVESISSVQTDLSSYIDQQANEILTSVKEDTSIVKTVTYYQVVESTEEGALEVVADDVEPTDGQIRIGDVSSCNCGIEVGDYVVLISASRDYEALKRTLQSLVSQTSDALELNFLTETVINAINDATGEVDSKYSFVNNYFRFDSDGALLIGTVDSPFILKLKKNRISFLEDNVEVAFISENKLYITNGEFLNNLQLGNFTFTPRANGNLSFKKVK